MPVIASATIPIKVNGDNTIDIIRQEIDRCGCISADSIAVQTGKPVNNIKEILSALAGNGTILCDSSTSICCADKEKLLEFSEKLRKLRKNTEG